MAFFKNILPIFYPIAYAVKTCLLSPKEYKIFEKILYSLGDMFVLRELALMDAFLKVNFMSNLREANDDI